MTWARSVPFLAASIALAAGSGLAQTEAPAGTADRAQPANRQTFRIFAADLPPRWRTMTPDEMFALEDSLPYLMRATQPGSYFSIGDVDAWLKSGFDGNAIVVSIQSGEIPIDESSIEAIREKWASESGGTKREFVSGQITAIGKDDHPAIRCVLRSPAEGDLPPAEALEFYVPTSGDMLILSFRSWQDDAGRLAATYEAVVDSLTFPRPPRGPEELSDRLYHAAIIGGLVGLALIVLRMMLRRPARP